MKTISAAAHASHVARLTMAGKPVFAKIGEPQDKACKRYLAAVKRKPAEKRYYPQFTADMSTHDYVRRYETLNGHFPFKPGFYSADTLNVDACTLYEGGLIDYAPLFETVEDAPRAARIPVPEVYEIDAELCYA